jgi:zinc protease
MAKRTFSLPDLDPSTLPGPDNILRASLENGITLLVRENFASPSVVLSGYLPVGSLADTEATAGLAYLTAGALTRGTRTRPFSEIFEALESIGANLSFSAGAHTISFQGKSLSEDLGLVLGILGDTLAAPAFPKTEVERLKAQHLTSLAIREQDTGAQAELVFDSLVYARHPYRIPTDGTLESVKGLQAADLRRFHRRYFSPQGMVLSVVGGIESKKVVDLVTAALGGWTTSANSELPALPLLKPLKSTRRKAIRLAGKQQSDIIIGAAGPRRQDENFLPAVLGNNVLGRFGMMGRIGESVRVSAGLAYYAYSLVAGGLGPGPWQVIAGVNPQNEERAIELIFREIQRFVEAGVSRTELLENQANFIGRLPMQLESNEGVAGALTHIERYELGLDYYQRYPELIASIKRDQVREAARRFLNPERLAIAIAGPKETA